MHDTVRKPANNNGDVEYPTFVHYIKIEPCITVLKFFSYICHGDLVKFQLDLLVVVESM